MQIAEVMTPDPIVAPADMSLHQALELFYEHDMRHLPIVEEGALIGILSDRDLRRYMPALTPDEDAEPAAMPRLDDPVTAVMNANLAKVDTEDEVRKAIDLMIEWKIGAVPVVERGTDRLVGIVSYVDLLSAARDFL